MLHVCKSDWCTEVRVVGDPSQHVTYDRFENWLGIPKNKAVLGGRTVVGFYHGFGVDDALDGHRGSETESMQKLIYTYYRRVQAIADVERRPTFEEWLNLCYIGENDRLTAFGIFATETGDLLVVHYHRHKLTLTDITEHSVIYCGEVYTLKLALQRLIEDRKEQLQALEKKCERIIENPLDETDDMLFASLQTVLRKT